MNEKLSFVENTLTQFDFVEWDRYTEYWDKEDRHNVRIYGWIDRNDSYKDFLTLWLDLDNLEVFSWQTSSKKYHDDICKILEDKENSTECKRAENLPIQINAIEVENSE